MILAFKFTLSSSKELYAAILNAVAKRLGCEYSLVLDGGNITLNLKGDDDFLKNAADELAKSLPHSIFLLDSSVEASHDSELAPSSVLEQVSAPNITVAQVFKFNQNDEIVPNELGVLSDVSVFGERVNAKNFSQVLKLAKECVLFDKELIISDSFGEYEVVKFSGESASFVMPTSIKHIGRAFIANEAAQIALASLEKPLLRLRTTAIFRDAHKHSNTSFMVGLAREIFTYALCDELAKEGLSFIAFKQKVQKDESFSAVLSEYGALVCSSTCYLDKSEKEFINSSSDRDFALFALSAYEFGLDDKSTYLRIFLSMDKNDEIELIKNSSPTKLLSINMPKSWEELIKDIAALPEGERLLENYKKEFSLPSGKLSLKESFFSVFAIVGMLLGLSDEACMAAEKVLGLADDFGGTKGVRVEFKVGGARDFDLARAVRSAMSFRLAGVGEKNLCFGLVESLAYFLDEFRAFCQSEYGASLAIGSGSLFASRSMFGLSTKHAGIKFSREFALESRL